MIEIGRFISGPVNPDENGWNNKAPKPKPIPTPKPGPTK